MIWSLVCWWRSYWVNLDSVKLIKQERKPDVKSNEAARLNWTEEDSQFSPQLKTKWKYWRKSFSFLQTLGFLKEDLLSLAPAVDENTLVLKLDGSWDSQKDYLGPESWDRLQQRALLPHMLVIWTRSAAASRVLSYLLSCTQTSDQGTRSSESSRPRHPVVRELHPDPKPRHQVLRELQRP